MNARHLLPIASFLCLAACTQQESVREIDWAKAALARNPNFEIVATDETAGVFTVRDTSSGNVTTLKLKDLVAAPLPAKAPARSSPAPASEPVESTDAPEDAPEALASNQTTGPVGVAPASTGTPLAEGPGYSITRGTGDRPEAATARIEGPGYQIERSAEHAKAARSSAPEPQAANVDRRTDPIICQGDRLMRIDDETIEFTGDAVIAEKGCDLYISNARIRAGGIGIIARQARVHIVNSIIGGSRGSYEVSDGAEIYVAQSTFTGVGRRFEGGTMNDLGGNSYESH
ncbi:MAG TPA: hypothetical protein VM146_19840 [Steroidobacteraceae bacterium]|nr:hypothetical protein [Steroidobacteraceae bacterium]